MGDDAEEKVSASVMGERLKHIAKELGDLNAKFATFADSFDRKFEGLRDTYVNKIEFVNLEKKVGSLNESVTWYIRLILGAVTLGILSFVIVKGGAVHGP